MPMMGISVFLLLRAMTGKKLSCTMAGPPP